MQGLGFRVYELEAFFMSMGAKPFLLNRVWVATAGAKGVGGGLGRGGGGA